MTRSTWSGGVTWSGTGVWMPDGLTASGPLMPSVAIAGELQTACRRASWRLGITDFLASLSPGTCSIDLVGELTFAVGDSIVLTVPDGTLWVGRVDTFSTTWGADSLPWTTVTGTDSLGALGEATITLAVSDPGTTGTLEANFETIAASAGVTIDVVDYSASPEPVILSEAYDGSLLATLNDMAFSSNAMVAMHRDGSIAVIVREAVTPADQVDVTGRHEDWTQTVDIAVDVNYWIIDGALVGSDAADIALYGQRPYDTGYVWEPDRNDIFDDWIAYGGSQRPTVALTIPLTSWDDVDVMLLDPFDWITRDTDDWQVLSVEHDASPERWTVSLTADNLLDLL